MNKLTRRKALAGAGATLLATNTAAQTKSKGKSKTPSIRISNPPTLAKPRGYSHVAEVLSGRTIYIAGQVAQDKDGNLVGKGDFRAQCVQVFENLKAALASVGADFTHVVKLNNYFTDMSAITTYRDVRDQYVNTQQPPASTAVQVVRLAREEWLMEVEAIAVVP
jgi:enamine deaminase RidA (YjgF/YER057c/UK114 family)